MVDPVFPARGPCIRTAPMSRGTSATRSRYQPVDGPHDALSEIPFDVPSPHPPAEHDPKKEVRGEEPPVSFADPPEDVDSELRTAGWAANNRVGAIKTRRIERIARILANLARAGRPARRSPADARPARTPPITRIDTTV